MKYFRGIKSVIAEPMKEFDFYSKERKIKENRYIRNRDGYHIIFPTNHDQVYPKGLKLWLPKEIFEEFFNEV